MNLLFFTHLLNGVLMIVFPIALGILISRKLKVGWRLWGIGAATFIASQIGHIPFNAWLTAAFKQGWLPAPAQEYTLIFNALVLGLSSGIWEETARYVTYRWWAKDARTWRQGLMLGAGHGGIEAIILGGLVLPSFVNMAAMRTVNLQGLVPADQLELASQQIQAYWSLPWYASLLGAVERVFALLLHLSASLLVLQVFVRRQIRWLWFAMGWHTLINGLAVYASARWGTYLTEGILGITALVSLSIIFTLRPAEETSDETLPAPVEIPREEFEMPKIEDTDEALERTRYQ